MMRHIWSLFTETGSLNWVAWVKEFIEGKKFLAGEGSPKLPMELEKDLKAERYC